MILILAEFYPSVRNQLTKLSLESSWQLCLEFLERMMEHDPESCRYLRTLKGICSYVQNSNTGEQRSIKTTTYFLLTLQGNTANYRNSRMKVNEAREGQGGGHITNPCLDPSAAPWVGDNPSFDMFTQFGDGDLGLDFFRDPMWTLGGGVPNDPMDSVMGDWSIDNPYLGF